MFGLSTVTSSARSESLSVCPAAKQSPAHTYNVNLGQRRTDQIDRGSERDLVCDVSLSGFLSWSQQVTSPCSPQRFDWLFS
jgi:hypothetical protein